MFRKWLLPLLLLTPPLLTLLWGRHLAADALVPVRYAVNLAAGQGLSYGALAGQESPPLIAPLVTAVLALSIRLGLPPLEAALLLGALGWSAAALALAYAGGAAGCPGAGLLAGALLAFNPAVVGAAGRPLGWIIATFWLTAALLWRRRWAAALAAATLLGTFFVTWPLGLAWPPGLAAPLLWSLALFALCLGAPWLAARRVPSGLEVAQVRRGLWAAVVLGIGLWQVWQLAGLWAARDLPAAAAQAATAAWISRETPAEATLLAAEALGLQAGRPTWAVPAAMPLDLAARLEPALAADPVDYVVTGDTLAWDLLREALWFRLAYEPVAQFGTAGQPGAPLIIYAYRLPRPDLGQRTTLNARVPDHLFVLGYQLGPQLAAAGATVNLLLALQRPAATLAKPAPFEAIARLTRPQDGATVAEWTAVLPATLDPAAWEAQQVIDETVTLPLPANLMPGGYQINLSLRDGPDAELWPFSFNNDVNRLDRIPLGWIAVPQEALPAPQRLLDAEFDNGIRLQGFSSGTAVPGADLPVTLFWEAEQDVQADYAVFVHLLDSAGQLVAGHDGRPASGRFPTPSWTAGLTVADEHLLALPPDLPPGTYGLRAGLYDPLSGARLPLLGGGDAADLGQVVIDGS